MIAVGQVDLEQIADCSDPLGPLVAAWQFWF